MPFLRRGRAPAGAASLSRPSPGRWSTRLSRCPDRAGLHLFHDLGGFRDVSGHPGFGPVSLGAANIDHVVLTRRPRLVIDAKGTGAGTLTTDARGRGVLVQEDGTERPEPWLDTAKMHSAAAVLIRLTGLRGWPVWVDARCHGYDPQVLRARAFRPGGTICPSVTSIADPWDRVLAVPQPPGRPSAVAALCGISPAAGCHRIDGRADGLLVSVGPRRILGV